MIDLDIDIRRINRLDYDGEHLIIYAESKYVLDMRNTYSVKFKNIRCVFSSYNELEELLDKYMG